jgi:hypothetical protein
MGEARPYFEPTPEAVRGGAWTAEFGGEERVLGDWLPYWDVSQTLRVKRQLEIDLSRVYAEARLPSDAQLALSVVFSSEFEDEACRITFAESEGVVPVDLEFDLEGYALGSSVELLTSLVLSQAGNAHDRADGPAAWRRGSVLWRDEKRVRLYGESSQFPVMEVDFAHLGLDAAAPWFVDIRSDLALPAMGSILLLLNDGFPLVTEAARELNVDRPELAAIRSVLHADVGRVLVEFALAQDDLESEWPDESLGAVLRAVVESRFSKSPSELRNLRDQDPAKWTASVQATFGLLREPLK